MNETPKKYVLSIPVDDSLISRLSVLAGAQRYSPERAAEIILTEALENSDLGRVHLELASIKRELKNLRSDISVATEAILVSNNIPSAKARKWVEEHLMERF